MSSSWDWTDPRALYLYPDCRTGLLGAFNNSILISAVQCELLNFITLVNSSIPVPLVSLTTNTFTSDLPEEAVFCRAPHSRDPYERIFVEVKESRIRDAGQGLFAKTGETRHVQHLHLQNLNLRHRARHHHQLLQRVEGEVGLGLGEAHSLQDAAGR